MRRNDKLGKVSGRQACEVNSASRNLPRGGTDTAAKSPRVYLRTFGCQMNSRDSEWVKGILLEKGFLLSESKEDADVIVFNTCSVRKHAEDRAISAMGQLLKIKDQRSKIKNKVEKKKIYGIIGCMAQAMKEELFKRLPELDLVCGTGEIHNLPRLINEAARSRVLDCGNIDAEMPEILPDYREEKMRTYVLISRGCSNYCSYCIVPYVRGKERSRRPEEVISEVGSLLGRGCRDIMLLGQNVNSYGRDLGNGIDFIGLLGMIDGLKGAKKISFMTSHPKDASGRLFEAMRDLECLSKDLHLPLQSGSDKILRAMNRGYDSAYYLRLVSDYRKVLPDGRLTTDIVVGFPGETEEDFEATKRMMREIGFAAGYIFKYSPRPPAPSAAMADDVPRKVKEERHAELLKIQRELSKKRENKGK